MKVALRYYTHKPRLKLEIEVDIPEPQVGDEIIIAEDWFSQVGKKYKELHHTFYTLRVIARTINCVYYKGPILIIELELCDHI